MTKLEDLLAGLASPIAGMGGRDLPDPPPAEPMALLHRWLEDAVKSGKYDDANAMTLATATLSGTPSARVVLCKAIEPQHASAGSPPPSNPTTNAIPALVFYTNYESRKGVELLANPRAAAVFHWPHAQRQARIEGEVVKTSGAESDEYFRTRHPLSRIGAWASKQSRPLNSRSELVAEAMRFAGSMAAATVGGAVENAARAIEDALRGLARAVGASAGAPSTPPEGGPQATPAPSSQRGAPMPRDLNSRPPWWGGFRLHIRSVELWSGREGRLHDRFRWELATPIGASPVAWRVERLAP